MPKNIVIVGALDTKGREFVFLKEQIEAVGLSTTVIDFGVMNAPELQPDIPRGEVARAGGDMSRLADGDHKDEAMRAMATGLAVLVRRLHEEGKVDGIIGMVNVDQPQDTSEKPLVVASMFGNTTTAVGHAQGIIEAAGYEVLTFHTTGTGGKTMEDLIADGYITALLDITAQVESFKNMTLAK